MRKSWRLERYSSDRRLATATNSSSLVRRGCTDKVKFKDYRSAVMVAVRYNERVVLQFGSFGPYWCRRHRSWHVGHYGKRDAILKVMAAAAG